MCIKGSVKTKPDYPIVNCRGEVRSPENSLLCVFGQANPAPTVDDWIVRFRFDNPFLLYRVTYPFLSLAGRGIFVQRVTTWRMEYGKN